MSEYGFRPPCPNCRGQCGCHNQPPYNPSFPPGGSYYPPPPGPGGPPQPPPYQPPNYPNYPSGGPGYQPGYNVPWYPPVSSTSKYLPPIIAENSLFRSCKHSWNTSVRKATTSVTNFSPISTINSIRLPFGKKKHASVKSDVHHHHHHHHQRKAYNWVDSSAHSGVPPDAVHGGTDIDGQPIYVGRAYHEGDWIPAKVIPGRRVTYISYNMTEIPVSQFQVLCGQGAVHWVPDSSGRAPQNAIPAGKTREGETLFIGRVNHGGALTVGKVHPSHRVCYIPFDGKEVSFPSYEVLVSR